MIMENDKFKELFADFKPEISDSADFMARFNSNLRLAEEVRRQIQTSRRKSRRAVIIAALAGFAGGAVSTICYPALERTVALVAPDVASTLTWAIFSAIIIGLIFTAYDLALAFSVTRSLD